MIPKLIDTHFHLDYYKNHNEIYEVINSLKQYTLCVTTSPGVYLSCKRLYSETKYLKFALGFHPLDQNLSEQDFSDFMWLAKTSNYIGEVGLDFKTLKESSKDKQLHYFDRIVKLCAEDNKLFSVHIRNAENEAIKILSKYKPRKCIIHWYSGSISQLKELISLGCYFSINANMAKAQSSIPKVKLIPDNCLLIESDGPFTKVNGAKFHPGLLFETYNVIAKLRNDENLIRHVFYNFKRLLTTSST